MGLNMAGYYATIFHGIFPFPIFSTQTCIEHGQAIIHSKLYNFTLLNVTPSFFIS
jgi:hypothetical protein